MVNYELNSGLCKALSNYLDESNYRINQNFIIQNLHLDSNNLKDEDFAEIIKGIIEQGRLKTLFYANNELGMESVEQLSLLVDSQIAKGEQKDAPQIEYIHLKRVTTDSEVMDAMFTHVIDNLPFLTQLKL